MRRVINSKVTYGGSTVYLMRRIYDGQMYGISIMVLDMEPRNVRAWAIRNARLKLNHFLGGVRQKEQSPYLPDTGLS